MKVSMNGLRRNIAYAFNDVALHQKYMLKPDKWGDIAPVSANDAEISMRLLANLRADIGNLIACFEPGDDDFVDMSDKIKLVEVVDDGS